MRLLHRSMRSTRNAFFSIHSAGSDSNSVEAAGADTGNRGPVSWVATFSSSRDESPALGFELAPRGKTISFDLYWFRRWTLSCSVLVDLLRRRWSTAMPMERATFFEMPAA